MAAPLRWALVTQPFEVAAGDAYRWWDEDGGSRGPDPDLALRVAAEGDPEALGPLLFNDLEPSVIRRHPEIEAAKTRLPESGALGAVMIGSGSSVAGLVRDREHAEAVAASIDDAVVATGPPARTGDNPGRGSRRSGVV